MYKSIFILIAIALMIQSCEKEEDYILVLENKYTIELTDEYEIQKVLFTSADTLVYQSIYSYSENKITVTKVNYNNILELKSVYFLSYNLADSCIDSSYYQGELESIHHKIYAYNEDGYMETLLGSSELNDGFAIDGYSVNYSYSNANNTEKLINHECTHTFEYTSLNNSLNIEDFMGDYCGKTSQHLKSSYQSGCHGGSSTVPESSEFLWVLNESGLVEQKTEIRTSSYVVGVNKARKTKVITEFEYLFI